MDDLLPANEAERQAALDECGILDTLLEQAYYEIVALAASIGKFPIASISLIDRDREWIKSIVGVDVNEVPRKMSFCAHTILTPEAMTVRDARVDERFSDNPFVVSAPHIRFYAGFPLAVAGFNVGALCVVDVVPRELAESERNALQALSHQVAAQLDVRRQMRLSGS